MKSKILIFHPALAPYRIDQFNALNELYDLHVVFLFENLSTFKYNQDHLQSQCRFSISFLLKGPRHKGRVLRFGMYQVIRKMKPDIIFGYEYSFTTQYLILLKRLGFISQKIGTSVDDSMDICNNIQSPIRFHARKASIKHLDFIFVMSNEVSQYYQNEFNLRENQIIVSPILQSPEKLRRDPIKLESIAEQYVKKYHLSNKKVLLFVGRLIPEKALSLFLNNVYSSLLDEKDLIFIIVGEGNEKETLQALIEKKKLDDKVIFTGKYLEEELHAWYLCASGFALPSLFEPFGAVVNEALIFGLPVLCSKYAGASCLINSENGIIFDPLDKEDTMKKSKLFLSIMNPLCSVELRLKPSLINDNGLNISYIGLNFNREWSKLIS